MLDVIDGDPDLEWCGDEREPNGDELDSAAGCNDDRLCPVGSVYMPDVRPRAQVAWSTAAKLAPPAS
jgi:hypothetical protein